MSKNKKQQQQEIQEEEELQDIKQQPPRKRRQQQNDEDGNGGNNIVTSGGGKQRRAPTPADNEDYDDGDIETTPQPGVKRRQQIRGNQDLWLLYLLFKAASFVCYFFLPIVFPKALSYIVVLMMTAVDFWIVKNIVGRKLVHMRWWYIIDNEGNERWHYESKDVIILFQDKLVFWGFLVIHPVLWGLFFVMNAITLAIFESSITVVCGLIAAVQFYGFKQCSNAHARKMKIRSRREMQGLRGGRGRGRGRGGRGGRGGSRGRGGLQEPLMQNDRYQN